MTRLPLSRSGLARALELLGRAPGRRPIPSTTEKVIGEITGTPTPEVDAHLHAVGERARGLHRKRRP